MYCLSLQSQSLCTKFIIFVASACKVEEQPSGDELQQMLGQRTRLLKEIFEVTPCRNMSYIDGIEVLMTSYTFFSQASDVSLPEHLNL